jgi:hypothetical protein
MTLAFFSAQAGAAASYPCQTASLAIVVGRKHRTFRYRSIGNPMPIESGCIFIEQAGDHYKCARLMS